MQRTRECPELLTLQARQSEERLRFLEYRRGAASQLRLRQQASREQQIEVHDVQVKETIEKAGQACQMTLSETDHCCQNERAIEDLESRHLEAEMKLLEEFNIVKRAILTRLRHMEAYCQNPSPPPTPQASTSSHDSDEQEKSSFPERRVTDRDYHNLAQQYRERDAMESLHKSKIEVLRGRQNKALEIFTMQKEREVAALQVANEKAVKKCEKKYLIEEEASRQALGDKKARLEARWRVQALIERAKMEKSTGLKFGCLPEMVVDEVGRRGTLS